MASHHRCCFKCGCCHAGVACSVPDTEAEGPGPMVTWDIAHNFDRYNDAGIPPLGGPSPSSVQSSQSVEAVRVDYEACDSAVYNAEYYFPEEGDWDNAWVTIYQNQTFAHGQGLIIEAQFFGSIGAIVTVGITIGIIPGQRPCVLAVQCKNYYPALFSEYPDCADGGDIDGIAYDNVPISVSIDSEGECPTAVHFSWGGSNRCSYTYPDGVEGAGTTNHYWYVTRGSVSITMPWTRCDDAEVEDDCEGACCHDEGCDQTTKAACDLLGGKWHAGQECSEAVCHECTPAGRRILCGGQFGVAAWDGSEWTLLPSLGGGVVQTLCVHNGELYAGGSFVGGVMRWVCDHWELAGDGLNSAVFRLKSIALPGLGQTLVAVGQFSGNVGSSTTIRRAGYLDPATQLWKEYGDGFNAVVWDVGAADGSEPMHADGGVFFAGAFTSSGSGASSVQYLALDNDGARGAFVSPVDDPAATPPDDWARAVFASNLGGTTCFFGGRFDNVGGVARSRFTSVNYSGGDWVVASSNFLNITGEVYRVLLFNAFFAAGSLASGGTTPLMRHAGGLMDTWTNITGGLVGRGHDVHVFNDFGGGVKLWLAGDIAQVITGDKRYVTSGDPETGPMTLVGDGSVVNNVAHALVAYTFPAPVALGGGTGSRPGRASGKGCCGGAAEQGAGRLAS